MLTRAEVERILLKKALHLFVAPERAKYYFTPEVDKKIRAADSQSVAVREGMGLLDEPRYVLNEWRDEALRNENRTYVASNGKKWTISLQNTCM